MTQRLPIPGSDDGTWGDILNGFLKVSHNSNGTLANNVVGTNQIQNNAVTSAQLDSATQNTLSAAATAVQTINGKTGTTVTLAASDVGALTESTANGLYAPTGAYVGTLGTPTAAAEYPRFLVDSYGADRTGVTDSTAAFQAAIAAAQAFVQGNSFGYTPQPFSGAIVEMGSGIYALQPGQVSITDFRVGLIGQGAAVTTLTNHGSDAGDFIHITDTQANSDTTITCAPVRGFSMFGTNATAPCNGLHYGDRPQAIIDDVVAYLFQGGGRGFWFRNDNGNLSEKLRVNIQAHDCTKLFDFDGSSSSGNPRSFDRGYFILGGEIVGQTSYPAYGFIIENNATMSGAFVKLGGNLQAPTAGQTCTWIQIGTSGTDTSRKDNGIFYSECECDGTTGTVYDIGTNGTNGWYGEIVHLAFLNVTGTFTAGTLAAPVTLAGVISAPSLANRIVTTKNSNWGVYDSSYTPVLVVTDSSSHSILSGQRVVVQSGSPTITLSSSSNYGADIVVVNQGSGTVTITPAAGSLYSLTGTTGNETLTQGQAARVASNATNWYRVQ